MDNTTENNKMIAEFMEYCKPYLSKACEGGFSGHNFNSYLPKRLKDGIPMHFRDLVSSVINSLAKKTSVTSTNRNSGRVTNNFMPLRYFDWMNDTALKTIPSGFETYYYPWMLYGAFKCLELYLEKI